MSSWSARRIRDVFLFQAIRFFRLRGAPERLARGFAIGLACSFYPTFGFGGFLAAFLARVLGGNLVAGFVGGTLLAFVWPLVFFLNIQTGGLFLRPPIVVDDLEDVTEQTVNALVWGKTFALGAAINSFVAAVAAYLVFLLVFERIRPSALNWLRQRVRRRKPA